CTICRRIRPFNSCLIINFTSISNPFHMEKRSCQPAPPVMYLLSFYCFFLFLYTRSFLCCSLFVNLLCFRQNIFCVLLNCCRCLHYAIFGTKYSSSTIRIHFLCIFTGKNFNSRSSK